MPKDKEPKTAPTADELQETDQLVREAVGRALRTPGSARLDVRQGDEATFTIPLTPKARTADILLAISFTALDMRDTLA
jgi:hypothetical protein